MTLPIRQRKYIFSLEATEDGHSYNMVMANSSKNKTYKWISSLSERFSLVEMIATGMYILKITGQIHISHLFPEMVNTADMT